MLDYYAILKVGRNETDENIEKAFRKLSLKYHPDKNKDNDTTALFQEINAAHEVLSDPNAKQAYDKSYDHCQRNHISIATYQDDSFLKTTTPYYPQESWPWSKDETVYEFTKCDISTQPPLDKNKLLYILHFNIIRSLIDNTHHFAEKDDTITLFQKFVTAAHETNNRIAIIAETGVFTEQIDFKKALSTIFSDMAEQFILKSIDPNIDIDLPIKDICRTIQSSDNNYVFIDNKIETVNLLLACYKKKIWKTDSTDVNPSSLLDILYKLLISIDNPMILANLARRYESVYCLLNEKITTDALFESDCIPYWSNYSNKDKAIFLSYIIQQGDHFPEAVFTYFLKDTDLITSICFNPDIYNEFFNGTDGLQQKKNMRSFFQHLQYNADTDHAKENSDIKITRLLAFLQTCKKTIDTTKVSVHTPAPNPLLTLPPAILQACQQTFNQLISSDTINAEKKELLTQLLQQKNILLGKEVNPLPAAGSTGTLFNPFSDLPKSSSLPAQQLESSSKKRKYERM